MGSTDQTTTHPKISIVTPSFNQGKFLEKTILSVLEQGYPNLEYIIIDGGSSDESVEVIKKYADRLAYWVSEPDRGQSHAINKGFEKATGEIFGWLNSDDWYHPGALQAVAEAFAANPDAGAVVGGGDYVDEAGQVIVRTIPNKVTIESIYSWFDDYFWQPSCFFSRQAWMTAGPLNESLHLCMDYDLWLRMSNHVSFATTSKILSASLRHSEAKTTVHQHESDLATLKLVFIHGGEKDIDIMLSCYARRLARFEQEHCQQITSLNDKVQCLTSELKQKNALLRKSEEYLQHLVNDKRKIIESMSWKVTFPIRCTLDKIKRLVSGAPESMTTISLSARNTNLLFVDYEVPHYDRFAGSRTNFMYLKLLKGMGLNVIFIPTDFRQVDPYTSAVHQQGIKTFDGVWASQNWQSWFKSNHDKIDFVFFNKPETTIQFIDFVKTNTSAHIIYQCHDLHYLRLQRKYELDADETTLAEASRLEQIERAVFEKTDVILTFSDVERKILEANYPGKTVATVPLYFYETFNSPVRDFKIRKDLLFVGGFAHAPNVDAVEWFAKEVFPEVLRSEPFVKLLVVGADPPDRITTLSSNRIELLGKVSDEVLANLYSSVRIAVIPLRFGAGVKGKAIEAMHAGVPIVATSIGLEGIPGITDICEPANTAHEFAQAVLALYRDEELLRECSNRGVEFAKVHFGIDSAEAVMRRILDHASQKNKQG